MQKLTNFTYGNTYHLCNRGINSCNIFKEEDNYRYFLSLYEKYVDPIAETYAWVLMPNHFHFLVRVKEIPAQNLSGFQNRTGLKPPHQYFSNLFNAYTKAFNKRYERHGALFERPFRRKLIEGEEYLKNVLLYIHNNPVRKQYVEKPAFWYWSSANPKSPVTTHLWY